MLLIYLILSFALVFLSGTHWVMWSVDNTTKRNLYWSIGLAVFGLYMMISMIGRAMSL